MKVFRKIFPLSFCIGYLSRFVLVMLFYTLCVVLCAAVCTLFVVWGFFPAVWAIIVTCVLGLVGAYMLTGIGFAVWSFVFS